MFALRFLYAEAQTGMASGLSSLSFRPLDVAMATVCSVFVFGPNLIMCIFIVPDFQTWEVSTIG